MALNRQDALKLLNVVTAQLAPLALKNIGLEEAMICVWGVYADKLGPARALCEQRGVVLTEDEVLSLGELWQTLWRLDPDKRPEKCPLCDERKPAGPVEFLCSCFVAKSVGKYIDYNIPGRIAEYAARHPGTWRSLTAESYACATCEKVCEVSLGQIADIFNRGRSWRTPSYCRKCSHEYFSKQKDNAPTNVGKPLDSSSGEVLPLPGADSESHES